MKRSLLAFFIFSMLISACSSKRELSYFKDLPADQTFTSAITNAYSPEIQAGDLISISVSSLDAASNILFNTGSLRQSGETTSGGGATADLNKEGYLVGEDGLIHFPIIGNIQLGGLTLKDAHEKMQEELIRYVKDPIVNIRFLNFKITVIGEVQSPMTFVIPNNKINVLEALGMAGDMTVYGKRNNVLIIREENGERKMMRLDFNSKDVFNSPYFYLRQNDIVYVEPKGIKDPSGERTLRIAGTIAALVTASTLIIQRLF